MRRWQVGILVFIAIIALTGCSQGSRGESRIKGNAGALTDGIYLIDSARVQRAASPPVQGDEAPNFVFVSDKGKQYALRDFRGHPVVVNFWATWCPPCRMEMPSLNKAYHTHKVSGLIMLAVEEMDKRSDILTFRQAMKVSLPMVMDTEGVVGRAYLVRGLPTTFFINTKGRVVVRWTGMLTDKALQKNLSLLLK